MGNSKYFIYLKYKLTVMVLITKFDNFNSINENSNKLNSAFINETLKSYLEAAPFYDNDEEDSFGDDGLPYFM